MYCTSTPGLLSLIRGHEETGKAEVVLQASREKTTGVDPLREDRVQAYKKRTQNVKSYVAWCLLEQGQQARRAYAI